jgi:hypothetical protein
MSGTSSLHQIAHNVATLNNGAISQIQRGEYSLAASSLGLSIQASRQFAELAPKNYTNDSNFRVVTRTSSVETSISYLLSPKNLLSSDAMMCDGETTGTESHTMGIFLWMRPLALHVPTTRILQRREDICQFSGLAAYVTIYNLALCHHLRALSMNLDEQQWTTCIQKAIAFYKYAEKMLRNIKGAEIGMIHSIILFNNMSHVYHLHGDGFSARAYLQQLMVYLFARTSESSAGHLDQAEEDHDRIPLDGFMASVMTLIGSNATALAA